MPSLLSRVKHGIQSVLYGGSKPAVRRKNNRSEDSQFPGSVSYWENRYAEGGNSGEGSYGDLAQHKARIINEFVRQNDIQSVIEFGAGDGNQLSLLDLPHYVGLDVSSTAIEALRQRYANDAGKVFLLCTDGIPPEVVNQAFDLAMSLDVIYHLIEECVYQRYMNDLFSASRRYVIIYSSNDSETVSAPHVRHRRFTDFVQKHLPAWRLSEGIENPFRAKTPAKFHLYSHSSSPEPRLMLPG